MKDDLAGCRTRETSSGAVRSNHWANSMANSPVHFFFSSRINAALVVSFYASEVCASWKMT